MSEYPVNCAKCGKYLGYLHTSEWTDTKICDECNSQLNKTGGKKHDKRMEHCS
jgi:uncharacterized CHY-type Zn-finger protein